MCNVQRRNAAFIVDVCINLPNPRLAAIRLHFGIAIRTFQIVMFAKTNMLLLLLLLPDRTDKSIAILSDCRWIRSCDRVCATVCDLFFKHFILH